MFYMFCADGVEETEALATLDILRRASIPCRTVSLCDRTVLGAHGINFEADQDGDEFLAFSENVEGIILPGGPAVESTLIYSGIVADAVEKAYKQKKLIAAICAAPSVLGRMGLLKGVRATCFPGFEEHLKGAVLAEECVVCDGNIITARSMAHAVDFGLAIVEAVKGKEKAEEIRKAVYCR